MQIFILDKDIQKNAQYYTDKHVIKILTEICQIMCTVYRLNCIYIVPEYLYKTTHKNHPCIKWCGQSLENFKYCLELAEALYQEYQYRYNKPDKHSRAKAIIDYLKLYYFTIDFKEYDLTPFAQAMPKQYKTNDAIKSYRNYYTREKQNLFKWTKRNMPDWIKENKL